MHEYLVYLLIIAQKQSGIEATGKKYGNDHGVWVPLMRAMKSNPDIPIIEVSTFEHEDMEMHIKMGEALAPLRYGIILIEKISY